MNWLRFENKNEPLASPGEFRSRVVRFFLIAFAVTFVWLCVGGIGFHFLTDLSWEDAFYNSALIATTMGPAFRLTTTPAKIFASFYALASGLVFVGVVGIAFAPIIHRFFHIFHLEADPETE